VVFRRCDFSVVLQVVGTFVEGPLPVWAIALYQVVTLLSYTNSAVNPVLYAFLTDNFRRTLAESCRRRSRTVTSSMVARGLAMCSNALYVGVQQPILLLRLADRPSINAASQSVPGHAETGVGEQERSANAGDRDADAIQTVMRALPTSSWIEHCKQSTTVELHVVYEDSNNHESP